MDHAELENLVGEYLLVDEDEAENLLRDSPRRRLRLLHIEGVSSANIGDTDPDQYLFPSYLMYLHPSVHYVIRSFCALPAAVSCLGYYNLVIVWT